MFKSLIKKLALGLLAYAGPLKGARFSGVVILGTFDGIYEAVGHLDGQITLSLNRPSPSAALRGLADKLDGQAKPSA